MTGEEGIRPGGAAGDGVDCRRVEDEDLVDRYVQDRLSPTERAAFEEHYFRCDRCGWLVALATAVRRSIAELERERAGGRKPPSPEADPVGPAPGSAGWPGGAAAPAHGAAAPGDEAHIPAQEAAAPGEEAHIPIREADASGRGAAPALTAAAPRSLASRLPASLLFALAATLVLGFIGIRYLTDGGTDERLRALGRLETLPAYIPPALRSGSGTPGGAEAAGGYVSPDRAPDSSAVDADSAERLYRIGMEAYAAGDVERSAQLLGRSVALDPTKPVRDFYLGVSLLADGRPEPAAAALRRALARPSLAAESRWYLARAHLLALRPDSALRHLDTLAAARPLEGTAADTSLAARARRLAASVRAVLGAP